MSGTTDKPTSEYEVGYKRPPQAHRFQSKTSGNPNGRPRKKNSENSISFIDLDYLAEECERLYPIKEGGRIVQMPAAQAIMRCLTTKAMTGDRAAAISINNLLERRRGEETKRHLELLEAAIEYKKFWQSVFTECKQKRRPLPRQLPHPDDVIVLASGHVALNGPHDETSKAIWDAKAEEHKQLGQELNKLFRNHRNDTHILKNERFINILAKMEELVAEYPPEHVRRDPEILHELSTIRI